MPKIHVVFDGGSRVDAEFDGHLYPDGPNRYSFEGTLKAQCMLNRDGESFANTVALDHAGKSMPWAGGVKKEIVGGDWNTFEVSGSGERKPGEEVSFRLGINTGLSGQYSFGSTVRSVAGGPPQDINENWSHDDMTTNVKAKAWADGPTGYVIKGDVQASYGHASNFAQKATLGHKGASGSWSYEEASGAAAHSFLLHGTRKSGEDLVILLGNTGGYFGAWVYDHDIKVKLPENF
ncbi:hypothetical protein [Streptomyces sp. OspMP-M43]|uniref:hypothetical protein n=1 Tax=Streptomyces sp. OspMP-M43 TaxID=1839781 RepID=UPI00081B7AF9|nr:hypothetical protein [Streptomyces sp. OspMP-M43]SCE60388.1 hypothetical protein GA0115261_109991 [Streptomyces sp. OspMP-M43]